MTQAVKVQEITDLLKSDINRSDLKIKMDVEELTEGVKYSTWWRCSVVFRLKNGRYDRPYGQWGQGDSIEEAVTSAIKRYYIVENASTMENVETIFFKLFKE